MTAPPDAAWLPAAARALGGSAAVVARTPLAGGYVAASVERVDLDVDGRPVPVVLKAASPVEVAAMRAVAVVRPVAPGPGLLAAGEGWIVVPFVDGTPPAEGEPVPDAAWEALARVHAHWWRRRPRGIPLVDAAHWRGLCDRTLVAVRGAAARTGDPAFTEVADALTAWRTDPRVGGALAGLPRTLVHGDAHRGNVLGGALIDWGNARVAPAGVDVLTLAGTFGAPAPQAYTALFDALRPGARPPGVAEVERAWADVHVHVHYLGFAADHLGVERVGEMAAVAERGLTILGPLLAT
ncbi:aminoglycoside phosphotransferase family protein [Pseudonocardia sp. KRD-182]|uniref:aminoglycoside phosphotransferase family protein n=1 Tax=Pseudonocardia oceani TaxID=2792013 RepID=UPI001C49F692|nr:aminoglycoside phosphotransferase family protein [Pseudonocardia oceani]MBW0108363.1 aminoglycoside phosphotransferase family protein [Pseudonocardia oceani]